MSRVEMENGSISRGNRSAFIRIFLILVFIIWFQHFLKCFFWSGAYAVCFCALFYLARCFGDVDNQEL